MKHLSEEAKKLAVTSEQFLDYGNLFDGKYKKNLLPSNFSTTLAVFFLTSG